MATYQSVFTPISDQTRVVPINEVLTWAPSSPDALFAELSGLQEHAKQHSELLLFRGQEDFTWLLDSAIARTAKFNLFGFKPGEYPTNKAASDIWFIRALYGTFHFKFGGYGKPSEELFSIESKDPAFDSWFEWMRFLQQHPSRDHLHLKGSHLLDWSESPLVAAWFASCKGNCDAVIYAFNATRSQTGHAHWKMRKFLDKMEAHDWSVGPINGTPIIFCPKKQTLIARAEAQQARYISQQDLRWPLEKIWVEQGLKIGAQFLLKIRVSHSWRPEILEYLKAHDVTAFSLFPDLRDGESWAR